MMKQRIRSIFAMALCLLLLAPNVLPALAEAPAAPYPVLSAKSYTTSEKVLVTWSNVANAAKYRVLISAYPYGSDNIVVRQVVTGNSFSVRLAAGKYACNMVATNAQGEDSNYGQRVYFRVYDAGGSTGSSSGTSGTSGTSSGKLDTPRPYSNKKTYRASETVRIRWKEVAGATGYGLFISRYPYGDGNVIVSKKLTKTSYELKLKSGRYAFNVIAYGSTRNSLYSNRVYFTVE